MQGIPAVHQRTSSSYFLWCLYCRGVHLTFSTSQMEQDIFAPHEFWLQGAFSTISVFQFLSSHRKKDGQTLGREEGTCARLTITGSCSPAASLLISDDWAFLSFERPTIHLAELPHLFLCIYLTAFCPYTDLVVACDLTFIITVTIFY